MSKVVVTGVAGFIGSHIAERLLNDGHSVVGIDDLSAGKTNNIPKGVWFIEADVCDIDAYDYCLNGVDAVFHNAASKKNICLDNPMKDLQVNGGGTLSLLRASVKKGVKSFIHASTGSVYGEANGLTTEETPCRPVSYYGVSKLAGESYVRMFNGIEGIKTTILRYFHVWGDRQENDPKLGGVIAIFRGKIANSQPLTVHGDGGQSRLFTHVGDVVEANIGAWEDGGTGGMIFNCNSQETTTILDAAHLLMREAGVVVPIHHTDPLEGDIYDFDVSNSLIRNTLNIKFKPFSTFFL